MKHTMIFDAGKGLASFPHLRVFTDGTLARRGNQWWLFAGGAGALARHSVVQCQLATRCAPPSRGLDDYPRSNTGLFNFPPGT
jgi:hypothetical protein